MNASLHNEDFFAGIGRIADGSVDLVVADPPDGPGKDYGNDSDHLSGAAYLDFSRRWVEAVLPKLKSSTRSIFIGKKWLEVGYNPKDIWSVSRLHRQDPEREAHPTQKPLEIVERMVLASCPPGDMVLDPFMGSGTVAVAALRHGRRITGFEMNPGYLAIAQSRAACFPDVAQPHAANAHRPTVVI